MKKLFLVDAYALIFKYYYAFLGRPMRNREGMNTSVVFGFVKFLRDIQKRERPDLLSLTEMYKVAASYGKGTPGYEEVMAAAARCFPYEPAVLNDRALDAMAAGHYAEAVELLEGVASADEPVLLNTLGVAYAGAGEPYKAESAFLRASEAGCRDAAHNLQQVRGVIDQL